MSRQTKRRKSLLLFATMALSCTSGLAQENNESQEFLKELSSRIELHGYAQAGYTWTHNNGIQTNTFDLKRSLLWAKARITDRWSFLFMMDFSSEVQEFYTDYRLSNDKSLTVRLGQFKNAFSLENPLSPTKQELINVYSQGVTYLSGCGSDPLFGVNYGRDLGVSLFGSIFNNHLNYEVQILQGQGINCRDLNNQKDVIVRLDYRPIDNLRLVATGQLGRGNAISTSIYNPNISIGENYERNRWSIGAEWKDHISGLDYWKNRPTNLRCEILNGMDGDVHSFGGYVAASVPIYKTFDVIAVVDYFDYNRDLKLYQTNTTVGVQHWFYRNCRAQMQYTICDPHNKKSHSTFQAQIQVAF